MKKDKGSTLVEALVALVILSLGLIPTLSTVLVANSLSSSIRNNLIAANLALNNNDFGQESKPLTWEEYTEKVETDIVGAKFKHMKEIDSDRETLHQESLARDAFEETRAYATRA